MRRKKSSDDGAVVREPSTTEVVIRFGPPLLLAVAALLFVVQNADSTAFNLLWFDFESPLWVMLVAFAVVGAAIFWFLARRRRKAKEQS